MMRRRRRILFLGGSLNQTTMMHQVARELAADHDVAFAPFYADGMVWALAERGLLDFTILGGAARRQTEAYLAEHGVRVDRRGDDGSYDLVVTATDLLVPRNLRGTPMVLVQEGMTDPEDWRYRLVRTLRLPRFLANTSMTGLSHAYDAFCVASAGYRDLFVSKGVDPAKIRVTGIPNFDDATSYLDNDFPHHGHVLAATSCLRETLKYENRPAFIRHTLDVADGRPVIFKLHPNERHDRATREIEALAPEAIVYPHGNVHEMIANGSALVTRYSSVVYTGVNLEKEVYCDLPTVLLRRLAPIQNGGRSAARIADVCREVLG